MGTKVDDYHPWTAAAVLYAFADTVECRAHVRQTVAAVLRTLGGVPGRTWPEQRAAELEREADEARRYARSVRVRARRLTGIGAWSPVHRDVAAR
jgi:hypothetical protein